MRERAPVTELRARDLRAGIARTLGRALRLRCPRCGGDELFTGWFAMRERCRTCELRYEREQGYFVGAIYVNYAVTTAVCLGGVLALDTIVGVTLRTQLAVALPLALLVPVVFFRYARSLWLAIDHLVTRADRASERRRRR
jgi:uncharacterized protein (DUF983 family)